MLVMSRVRFTAPLAARRHSRVLESDLAFQVSVSVPRKQSLNILGSGDANSPIPTGLTDGQPPALSVTPNGRAGLFPSVRVVVRPASRSLKSGPNLEPLGGPGSDQRRRASDRRLIELLCHATQTAKHVSCIGCRFPAPYTVQDDLCLFQSIMSSRVEISTGRESDSNHAQRGGRSSR